MHIITSVEHPRREVLGFPLNTDVSPGQAEEVLSLLKQGDRVSFVDLTTTDSILQLVVQLTQAGIEVFCYYDHHLDPHQGREFQNTRRIRQRLGRGAMIYTRREMSSCPRIIEAGEWMKTRLRLVLFHDDLDGFLSFLKGCHIVYPELEDDADIIEGASRGLKLSPTGKLMADTFQYLVPSFSQDPTGHLAAKRRHYQMFTDWLTYGGDWSEILDFVDEVDSVRQAAEELAFRFAREAEVLDGQVVFSDFLPNIAAGQQIAFPVWKQAIIERFGPVLLCSTGTGLMGKQVYIELPREWQRQIDLRDFLPAGLPRRASYRIQIPLERWQEFLGVWQRIMV